MRSNLGGLGGGGPRGKDLQQMESGTGGPSGFRVPALPVRPTLARREQETQVDLRDAEGDGGGNKERPRLPPWPALSYCVYRLKYRDIPKRVRKGRLK